MEKINLEIDQGIYGKRAATAYAKDGLCVHKTASGKGWLVTHVASTATVNGRSIWPTKKDALACLDRLLGLPIDWRKSYVDIQHEFRNHAAAIRECSTR